MMKRKTSQFQACLPLIDTTLCNSPDNIINDYKWNEYFVTAKCSAYKSHKRGFKQDAETHRQCRYETNETLWLRVSEYHTLLDFAVILQLLTVNKSSKIPYIWFTVNYCNMHCIMGIFLLSLQ